MKFIYSKLHTFYTFLSTAALCVIATAYYYESRQNHLYESGQLVNASSLQQQDWLTVVEQAQR